MLGRWVFHRTITRALLKALLILTSLTVPAQASVRTESNIIEKGYRETIYRDTASRLLLITHGNVVEEIRYRPVRSYYRGPNLIDIPGRITSRGIVNATIEAIYRRAVREMACGSWVRHRTLKIPMESRVKASPVRSPNLLIDFVDSNEKCERVTTVDRAGRVQLVFLSKNDGHPSWSVSQSQQIVPLIRSDPRMRLHSHGKVTSGGGVMDRKTIGCWSSRGLITPPLAYVG